MLTCFVSSTCKHTLLTISTILGIRLRSSMLTWRSLINSFISCIHHYRLGSSLSFNVLIFHLIFTLRLYLLNTLCNISPSSQIWYPFISFSKLMRELTLVYLLPIKFILQNLSFLLQGWCSLLHFSKITTCSFVWSQFKIRNVVTSVKVPCQ